MFGKKMIALMLMASLLGTIYAEIPEEDLSRDSLGYVNPDEGCYAKIRSLLDGSEVVVADETVDQEVLPVTSDQEVEEELESQEPTGEEDLNVGEPEDEAEAPEGVIGLEEEGQMVGEEEIVIVPDELSPEEEAATEELLQNPEIRAAIDEADNDEELAAILAGVLGGAAGVGGLMYALNKKKLLPGQKKMPVLDGDQKAPAKPPRTYKVKTGEIKTTAPDKPLRIKKPQVTTLPDASTKPGGKAERITLVEPTIKTLGQSSETRPGGSFEKVESKPPLPPRDEKPKQSMDSVIKQLKAAQAGKDGVLKPSDVATPKKAPTLLPEAKKPLSLQEQLTKKKSQLKSTPMSASIYSEPKPYKSPTASKTGKVQLSGSPYGKSTPTSTAKKTITKKSAFSPLKKPVRRR